jgi:hypothetical protein
MQDASTGVHAVATDKEEAEQMHREALHCVVHDIMAWLVEQRRLAAVQVNQCRNAKSPEKQETFARQSIRHKVFVDAVEKLKSLRIKHRESSARASVIGHQLADGKAMNDPTPEEIAEGCQEIQRKWSDSERESRSTKKVQAVEIEPTNFIF